MHQGAEGHVVKVIALLLCAALVFGCIGGESPQPEQNQIDGIGVVKPPPVGIVVTPQKNQTVGKNESTVTPPPPPAQENDSTLGYVEDPDALLGVFFIDVGESGPQSDAILIKKGDLDILVDSGSVEKGGKVVDFLRSHEVDDIEVLVSTGADPRRYGGMGAVADSFPIEELWWSGEGSDDLDYMFYIDKASAKAAEVRFVSDGFTAVLNGISFRALNPPASDADRFDDPNNNGIVLRLDDKEFSMLLTSGIQSGGQGRLI
ncbi:MAG: hypothetical protein ACOY58_03005, partial [Candidatus Micrarchaeota archaeon]